MENENYGDIETEIELLLEPDDAKTNDGITLESEEKSLCDEPCDEEELIPLLEHCKCKDLAEEEDISPKYKVDVKSGLIYYGDLRASCAKFEWIPKEISGLTERAISITITKPEQIIKEKRRSETIYHKEPLKVLEEAFNAYVIQERLTPDFVATGLGEVWFVKDNEVTSIKIGYLMENKTIRKYYPGGKYAGLVEKYNKSVLTIGDPNNTFNPYEVATRETVQKMAKDSRFIFSDPFSLVGTNGLFHLFNRQTFTFKDCRTEETAKNAFLEIFGSWALKCIRKYLGQHKDTFFFRNNNFCGFGKVTKDMHPETVTIVYGKYNYKTQKCSTERFNYSVVEALKDIMDPGFLMTKQVTIPYVCGFEPRFVLKSKDIYELSEGEVLVNAGFRARVLPKYDPAKIELVLELVRKFSGGGDHAYNWVLSFIASIVTNPTNKTGVLLVCRGGGGAGKSSLINFLQLYLLGPANCYTQGDGIDQILQDKNGFLDGKSLIGLHEASDIKHIKRLDSKGRVVLDLSPLKCLITDPIDRSRDMFKVNDNKPGYVNFILCTNEYCPILLGHTPEDNRRIVLIESKPADKNTRPWFKKVLYPTLKKDQSIADHFLTFLFEFAKSSNFIDVGDMDLAPNKELLAEMYDINKEVHLKFKDYIKEGNIKWTKKEIQHRSEKLGLHINQTAFLARFKKFCRDTEDIEGLKLNCKELKALFPAFGVARELGNVWFVRHYRDEGYFVPFHEAEEEAEGTEEEAV